MKGMQKITRQETFERPIRYAFRDKYASFLCASGCVMASTPDAFISELTAAAKALDPKCQKPAWHQALRLPPGEHIEPRRLGEVAAEFMSRMGFSPDHQWVAVMHDDPNGQHVHIIASRVGLNGRLYKGKQENLISTRIIQKLERVFGLQRTKGPTSEMVPSADGKPRVRVAGPKLRRPKPAEVNRHSRIERERASKAAEAGLMHDSTELALKAVQRILSAARTAGKRDGLTAFIRVAQSNCVTVRANVASTGRVNGLSFALGDYSCKASRVGASFSWAQLSKALGYDEARDRALLEALSARHQPPSVSAPVGVADVVHPQKVPLPPVAAHPIVIRRAPSLLRVMSLADQLFPSLAAWARRAQRGADARRQNEIAEAVGRVLDQLFGTNLYTTGATNAKRHPHPAGTSLAGFNALSAGHRRTLAGATTLNNLRSLSAEPLARDAETGRPDEAAGLLPSDEPADVGAGGRGRVDGLRRAAHRDGEGRSESGRIGRADKPLTPDVVVRARARARDRKLDLEIEVLIRRDLPSIDCDAAAVGTQRAVRLNSQAYDSRRGTYGLLYIRTRDDRYAFIDTGRRLKVAHVDVDTVQTALRLAAKKWDRLVLTGTPEFQALCRREAVRLGLASRLPPEFRGADARRLKSEARAETPRPASATSIPVLNPPETVATKRVRKLKM